MQQIRQIPIPRHWRNIVPLLMLLSAVSLAGCRRATAPPRDRLRTQQIQDVFAALAVSEPAHNIRKLERLHDLMPEEPFYALALVRESQRETIEEINALLLRGRFDAAASYLREQREAGTHVSGALAEAEAVCKALQALHTVAARCPFPNSTAGDTALAELAPHLAVLERCEDFPSWLEQQQAAIAALRREERAARYRQLLAALDQAVVQGDGTADELASQVRARGKDHPSALLLTAGLTGQWDTLTDALDTPPACAETDRVVEIAACLFWRDLPPGVKERLWLWCTNRAPFAVSGSLLRALLAAERGDVAAVRVWLGRLSGAVRIHPEFLGCMMEQTILPKEQFGASCWRSAFPSVPDVLRQIGQIRAQLDQDRH